MIKKLTHKGALSGVSSPLLPLVYCDAFVGASGTDGLYAAQNGKGENIALFSLKNGRAVFAYFEGEAWEEIGLFLSFNGVGEILSSSPVTSNQKELPLMCKTLNACEHFEKTSRHSIHYLNRESSFSHYEKLSSVVGEDVGKVFDFSAWYINLSTKIAGHRALFNYITEGEKILAYSCVNAFYKDSGLISGVYTVPPCRGKGYAGECLESLFSACAKSGVKNLYLWCEKEKIPFYEKFGFTQKGKVYIGECL